jgi:hypothetical protein
VIAGVTLSADVGRHPGEEQVMRRLPAGIGVSLALSVTLLMISAPTASAASPHRTASLPKTVLKIRSIDWQPRSGAVVVKARVKCTGKGSNSWQVSLAQKHGRDRGSAKVPCNGEGFRSSIVLEAHKGRFHPGSAIFAHGSITCGRDACIGFQVARTIRISPR